MIIPLRMAELGINSQKIPELWVSHIIPRRYEDDLTTVNVDTGIHTLAEVLQRTPFTTNIGTVLVDIGTHRVSDTTFITNVVSEATVALAIEAHKITNSAKDTQFNEDVSSVSLDVVAHTVYAWGVYAEQRDDTNVSLTMNIDNHILEESNQS